ncbi:MAG: hypothetical protein LBC68_02555 [Prevotellaceae bacterium]|jgi:hypothetical protein|nr:hypothetical protein [Prevotellaceae bacterium]
MAHNDFLPVTDNVTTGKGMIWNIIITIGISVMFFFTLCFFGIGKCV